MCSGQEPILNELLDACRVPWQILCSHLHKAVAIQLNLVIEFFCYFPRKFCYPVPYNFNSVQCYHFISAFSFPVCMLLLISSLYDQNWDRQREEQVEWRGESRAEAGKTTFLTTSLFRWSLPTQSCILFFFHLHLPFLPFFWQCFGGYASKMSVATLS